MSKYKVLPLDWKRSLVWQYSWQYGKEPTEQELKEYIIDTLTNEWRYEQVCPVFYRDGWYYNRLQRRAWYELCGTAWRNKGIEEDFEYTLTRYNTKWLEKDEIASIHTLMLYGSCPNELRQLLHRHNSNAYLRDLKRQHKLDLIQFKKGITDGTNV
jgi:hypothetical protein